MTPTPDTRAANRDMLPKALSALAWEPMTDETEFFDGDVILAAVGVCWPKGQNLPSHVRHHAPNGHDWYYELNVVHLSCDAETPLSAEVNGDAWGWELEDIDFFVRIK